MNHRNLNRTLAALVVASLLVAAPALASTKNIHKARLHRVTQITAGDVALARNLSSARDRAVRVARTDYGRQVLIPNPDGQRQVVLPNPDGQRQMVLPNPDAQRQALVPNPDAQ